MRILHTVEFYRPQIGGAERVVQRLSEGLVRRGHEVVVATSWHPGRAEELCNGVRVVSFKISGNLAWGLRGEVGRYRDWLQRESFDVIMNYAAQCWPTDAALSVLPHLQAPRVLATCGFSGLYGLRRPLYLTYFWRLRRWIREYDALVYHSDGGADAAFGRRYGPGRQVVIPNGADSDEFAGDFDFRARWGVTARHILLHVGNHYRVKGHRDLGTVAHALRGLDVALVIIGDAPAGRGGCWSECVARARRDRRIVLLRELPRTEVAAAFRAADVVLLTSRFEAAPLVLVEAMAAGVPFVSYDVGNARSLPGGLVVSGPQAMADAVAKLLGDDERRRALGGAGRAYQRGALEWETIVAAYEALYASLLDRRRHPGSASPG